MRRASGEATTRPPCPPPFGFAAACGAAAGVGAACAAAGGWAGAAAGGAGFGASAFAGAGAPPPPAALTLFGSSPSPAISAMSWFTGTSAVPSGTTIFASTPSSMASTSIVALSVSISAMTSPDLTVSPSFLSHFARLPFSIVGDRAGIRMLMGMRADPELLPPPSGRSDSAEGRAGWGSWGWSAAPKERCISGEAETRGGKP